MVTATITSTGPTSGIGPLGVHLDADSASTSSDDVFREVNYRWTSTHDASWVEHGPVVKLVIEEVGSHTITVQAMEPGGGTDTDTIGITVTDPDAAYATTDTIVVSTDGVFTGAPTGATQITTSSFDTAMGSWSDGKRILFKRGQTFTATSNTVSTTTHGTIGAWGTGDRPRISVSGSSVALLIDGPGIRIMDLDGFESGTAGLADFVKLGGTLTDLVILRVKTRDFDVPIRLGYTPTTAEHDRMIIQDLDVEEFVTNGVFWGGTDLGVIDCNVSNAVSGGSHCLRTTAWWGMHIARGTFLNPGATRHCLKLHGDTSERLNINGCTVEGPDSAWLVTIGPPDSSSNQNISTVVVDAVTALAGRDTEFCLYLSGADVTTRNCVFEAIHSGAGGSFVGAGTVLRGIETAPSGHEHYNHTQVDRIASGYTKAYCAYSASSGYGTVGKNMLQYVPGYSSTVDPARNCSTTGGSVDASSTDPFYDSASRDYRLAESSAPVGAGTAVPVVNDHRLDGLYEAPSSPDTGAYRYLVITAPIDPTGADWNIPDIVVPGRLL